MKIALLIGINYYTSIPEYSLQSINSITTMKNLLISHYGYTESNIFMLRDDDPTKMPTRSAILLALNDLVVASKSMFSYSEVCIHYCGHGSHIQNEIDGVPKVEGIIIPVDYKTEGFIEDDVIFKYVRYIQCPVLLVMDTFNSGNMCDLEYGFTNMHSTHENKTIVKNPNIIMFSGSDKNGTVLNIDDITVWDDSVFTNSLLQSLKTNGYYKAQIGKVNQDIYEWLRQQGKHQPVKHQQVKQLPIPIVLQGAPVLNVEQLVQVIPDNNIIPIRKSILPIQHGYTGVNMGYSNRIPKMNMVYHS